MKNKKAISLIVLVITIIVMIIITATTIVAINNVIEKAEEAAFRTEMSQLKQQVTLTLLEYKFDDLSIDDKFEKITLEEARTFSSSLKREVAYWGKYDLGVTEVTREYAERNWEYILDSTDVLDNLYYVSKEAAEGKEKTYLYDAKAEVLYKIPVTKIGKYAVHSIKELNEIKGISNNTIITTVSKMVTVDEISYYEPDLSGFVLENTSIVYYDETLENSVTISAKEYLENGKQRVLQRDGKTYEFYNYSSQKWANILVKDGGIESYWVWVPRYAYKADDVSDIKFVDIGSTLEEGYILHNAFVNDKKGIWGSKYEPIQNNETEHNFAYYLPDLTGFDPENTYIEVYNSETQFFEETKLSEIDDIKEFAKNNNWFDYNNQIWANIKTTADGVEAWWVWIPRYAYNISGTNGENISIKFVDLNDNPLDGSELGSNYIVHPAFVNGKKGIWGSKYEPIQK